MLLSLPDIPSPGIILSDSTRQVTHLTTEGQQITQIAFARGVPTKDIHNIIGKDSSGMTCTGRRNGPSALYYSSVHFRVEISNDQVSL
jgi:hypothetical protein